ncbi:MAG: hypothetical protein IPO07_21560 [Haliscomenobacter sp.]|nr:hypothetical protein [Haliscomenobacter sp.]MBK9491087.1 hypothetical protein [Haliscomenobacter sp.]
MEWTLSCATANNTSPVTDYVGSNADRGLSINLFEPNTDHAAGDQVGKVSLGDIDISDDGRYLYIVNLYDRHLYKIDLQDPLDPQVPTSNEVERFEIPDLGTISNTDGDGEHRPWGLKFYRGKLYVGVILSGQDANGHRVSSITANGNGADLRGYVVVFDHITEAFSGTPAIDFDFNYGRERPWIP